MITFDDLTEYSHLIEPYACNNVLNIGWIDPQGSFPTGFVADSIKEALLDLAFGEFAANAVVESSRALPVCSACEAEVRIERGEKVLTDAELWVPGKDKVYASPILILHYIQVHDYLPPRESWQQ